MAPPGNERRALEINKAAWEQLALVYDERNPARITHMFERFASRLPRGSKIMDLGCGTGKPFLEYLEASGFTKLHGMDISAAMARLAAKNVPSATIETRSMTSLDEIETCQGIIASYTMLLLPPATFKVVARKIGRALIPGGLVYVSLNDVLEEGTDPDAETLVSIAGQVIYSRAYSKKEVIGAFAGAGLDCMDFARREINSKLFGKELMMEFMFQNPLLASG